MLGYCVGQGSIKPDSDRLKALQELPPPSSKKSLQRTLGLFAYYAKWVQNFSDKIVNLKSATKFPLGQQEIEDFESLKTAIANAALQAIDDDKPFTVECDASEVAIAATLNQGGRPVAFFSRTLSPVEQRYPAVEREAMAIVESVNKWSHLLIRQSFKLITDQRSVAFMLDNKKRTKIKNNKILCWRLELSPFSYEIEYRPGKLNTGPDMLTRAFCSAITPTLLQIHQQLGCPRVKRLWHFVRQKNLPYSLADVKKACEMCQTCAEIKPNFFSPPLGTLIKATKPMERLNIDFKGPLPSTSKNKYFLCIVDEYSRFPFVYPCSDMSTPTVTRCFDNLFHLFGTCSFVHSDRWKSFKAKELKDYFLAKGIPTSYSTPYHPLGNSQVERYNGIVWQAICSLLKSKGLEPRHWQSVLNAALHGIRSLLCTATNQTPHERFFGFARRSSFGTSLPRWLSEPGPVLLRNFVKGSKFDDKVYQVELTEANPLYARVRFPNGREGNVSVRDLAPYPRPVEGDTTDAVQDNALEESCVVENNDIVEGQQQTPAADMTEQPNDTSSNNDHIVEEVQVQNDRAGSPIETVQTESIQHPTDSTETYRVQESGGVNRWVSTRSNKGIPPKRYGDVASMISFIVE